MHNNPFLSFIVPVYNVESYIQGCVQSIVNQTNTNFEILLIDDGSTDSSGTICDHFAKEDNRIKVFHTTNEGVSSARNLGILNSKGVYIGFVDADDSITPDYVSTLYEFQLKHPLDIIQFGFIRISGRKSYSVLPPSTEVFTDLESYHKRKIYVHSVWSYIIKKSVIVENNISFTKGIKYSEDQEFLLKILSNVKTIGSVNIILYNYVDNVNSAVNKKNNYDKANCQIIVARNIINYYSQNNIPYNDFIVNAINHLIDDYFFYLNSVKKIRDKTNYKGYYNEMIEISTNKRITDHLHKTLPFFYFYKKYIFYKQFLNRVRNYLIKSIKKK